MHKFLNSHLILRVAAGLFFLVPGLFKIMSPADFTEFLNFFPSYFDSISHLLFWGVAILQIVGGLALIAGKQFRAMALPLAMVAIVALLTTVPHDNASALQYISTLMHIMTFGMFMGLFMIGPKGDDLLDKIVDRDQDRGWDLVRVSLAFFWIGLGSAIWFAPALMSAIPGILPFDLGFIGYALVGLIALAIGFALLVRFFTKITTIASMIGFVALLLMLALPDMANSKIGLINLLFMVLGVAASKALMFKECGTCCKKK